MPRPLAPCGTMSAYNRHHRRKEDVDDACREAARVHKADQRARQAARAKANSEALDVAVEQAVEHAAADQPPALADDVEQTPATGVRVTQAMGYGQTLDIDVPVHTDLLESAQWRLARIRAAMIVAGPRDVAPLAKAEADTVAEIAELAQPAEKQEGPSLVDQLTAKREARLAERRAAAAD